MKIPKKFKYYYMFFKTKLVQFNLGIESVFRVSGFWGSRLHEVYHHQTPES
jgi:hypothetical protein